jgi:glycosyltransferase involved in cell wall biosynthesis
VIVADDGSSDDSAEVADGAGARVLRGHGWGAAGARNAALAAARGEFVHFLDSDDLLLPTALERLAAALEDEAAAPFAYGRALAAERGKDGWRPAGLIAAGARERADPLALFARNAVPSAGALVRADAARAAGGYDASLPFSEDHDFYVRLALRGAPVHVPALVAIHRRHGGTRHATPAALASDLRISRLAEDDARLRAQLPRRNGVQLAELALDAARARDPARLAQHVPTLLKTAPVTTLRAAGRHFRGRYRWADAGEREWERDPDLRAWLARH